MTNEEELKQLLQRMQLCRPPHQLLDAKVGDLIGSAHDVSPRYRAEAATMIRRLFELGFRPYELPLDEQHEAYMTEWINLIHSLLYGMVPPTLEYVVVTYDAARGGASVGSSCRTEKQIRMILQGVLECGDGLTLEEDG